MTWSYSGNPASSSKDEVRFLAQDTVKTDPLLEDEEIDFLITQEGSAQKAAIKAAQTIMAKFARFVDESVGQVKKSFSQRFGHYRDLVDDLNRHAAMRGAVPFAGALTETQKDVQEDNDDRIDPIFTRDMNDFTRQPNQDQGRATTAAVQEEDED